MDDVPELLTRRLRLRGWIPADRLALTAIKSDPRNWDFIRSGPSRSLALAAATLDEFIAEWERDRIGSWAIEERDSGNLAGDCGVKLTERGPQLAYMIAGNRWGNGFATEAGAAVLRFVFTNFHWPAVYASTDAVNVASLRVLDKLGMRLLDTVDHSEWQERWYAVRRDDRSTATPI